MPASVSSSDGDVFVGAEGVAHGVADFAERSVGFDGIVDERHQVVFALRRRSQSGETPRCFFARTVRTEFLQSHGRQGRRGNDVERKTGRNLFHGRSC